MNSFAASAHGRRICLLEFSIILKLKNNTKKYQRGNATTAIHPENVGLISLNNSYLVFSFFIFLTEDNVIAIRCNCIESLERDISLNETL